VSRVTLEKQEFKDDAWSRRNWWHNCASAGGDVADARHSYLGVRHTVRFGAAHLKRQ
jgi:hypothetical protein